MKSKLLGLLAVGLLAGPLTAEAVTITYSTSSSELCVGASGCGLLTQTIGTVTVTFAPVASVTVDASPTTIGSLGEIHVSGATSTEGLGGLNLFVVITQSAPSAGSASISGHLSGNIFASASIVRLLFTSPMPVDIGTISYSALQPVNGILVLPPLTNSGVTAVEASITAPTQVPEPGTAVPEPATLALLGLGLFGLAGSRRRKAN